MQTVSSSNSEPALVHLNREFAAQGVTTSDLEKIINVVNTISDIYPDVTAKFRSITAQELSAPDKNGIRVLDHLHNLCQGYTTQSQYNEWMAARLSADKEPSGNTGGLPILGADFLGAIGAIGSKALHMKEQQKVYLAADLIDALATFGGSTQDSHATCATETISFLLDHSKPGEWARIAVELWTKGKAELVDSATGKTTFMALPPGASASDHSPNRTQLDRMMQAAFKNLVAPEGTYYSNAADQFVSSTGQKFGNGITDEDAARILTLLSGKEHSHHVDAQLLAASLSHHDGKPLYAALKWSVEGEHGFHAVAVTEIRNDRVYFRNPWGPSSVENGADLDSPPRRIEDNRTGLESMSIEDFRKRLDGIVISKEREIELIHKDFDNMGF
jgi:hypothetical protein